MAPRTNLALIFKAVPTGMPVPGKDLAVEDVEYEADQQAPEGGLVLEILYASFDPYLRGRMRGPDSGSYMSNFQVGEPITTGCLANVIKSGRSDINEGALIMGMMPVMQYLTVSSEQYQQGRFRQLDKDHGPNDIRDHLGALGMPGLTAYSSLFEIGKPKKGETIFISSAAGAVGQIVGQLAKHEGLKVIGSVGSDDKLKFIVDDLGFDGGFNYKTESPGAALDRLLPEGIDIYYENVGGEQLEASLARMNTHGRVVACGMISQYNLEPSEVYGVRTLIYIVAKQLTIRGFLVMDPEMMKWAPEHQQNMTKWLNDGSFKALTSETVGIENAAEACVGVLKGENFGKAVLKIKVVGSPTSFT